MSGAQAAQAAPATGMQRIELPTSSYQHDSPPLMFSRLLNLYAEEQPEGARAKFALISTPGLRPFIEIGSGPVHAINGDSPGLYYLVSGTKFYRASNVGTGGPLVVDDLGEIGTPDGALPWPSQIYTIAVGVEGAVVCVPPNAFTCTHTGALHPLGGTFPGDVSSVAYLDGYFVFTSTVDLSEFFICGLLDPTNYNALDFAHADAASQRIGRVIAHRGDLWLMGDAAIEVWYNSGDADFPFRRRQGGVIPVSLGGPANPAQADGSVFWIGQDGIVYRSVGYQAKRISTYGIEQVIRYTTGGPQAVGLAYSQGGHIFYVITFGTRTLAYDCATQQWHDRSSSTDGSAAWRASCASWFTDIPLFGDSLSGLLFLGDQAIGTENGATVIRQVTLPPLHAVTRRAFCARLEVEMQSGGPTPTGDVVLDWSDDSGFSWGGGPRTLNAGTAIMTRKRVFTTRLGSFRQRVFRLTAQKRTTIYAVDADLSAGAH